MSALSTSWKFLKEVFSEFGEDDCPMMAGAIAYYTTFALPPLMILLVTIAGFIWSPAEVQHAITGEAASLIGPKGTSQIESIISYAHSATGGSIWRTIVGIGAVIVAGTGAFVQLQAALNRAWEVKPDPEASGLRNFLVKRLLSLGMILALGFLLGVSLALSALLSAFGTFISGKLGGLSDIVLWLLNLGLSFTLFTLLFAAIFKVMPDAVISWSNVWMGAAVTAALFIAGKFAIGFYLGKSSVGTMFGAAGSLAILLIWIYYSSMLLLIGAEFTQAWAERHGTGITPESGAVRVVHTTKHVHQGRSAGSRDGHDTTSNGQEAREYRVRMREETPHE